MSESPSLLPSRLKKAVRTVKAANSVLTPFGALPPIVRNHIIESSDWRAAEWNNLSQRPGGAAGAKREGPPKPATPIDQAAIGYARQKAQAKREKLARKERIKGLAALITGAAAAI